MEEKYFSNIVMEIDNAGVQDIRTLFLANANQPGNAPRVTSGKRQASTAVLKITVPEPSDNSGTTQFHFRLHESPLKLPC